MYLQTQILICVGALQGINLWQGIADKNDFLMKTVCICFIHAYSVSQKLNVFKIKGIN